MSAVLGFDPLLTNSAGYDFGAWGSGWDVQSDTGFSGAWTGSGAWVNMPEDFNGGFGVDEFLTDDAGGSWGDYGYDESYDPSFDQFTQAFEDDIAAGGDGISTPVLDNDNPIITLDELTDPYPDQPSQYGGVATDLTPDPAYTDTYSQTQIQDWTQNGAGDYVCNTPGGGYMDCLTEEPISDSSLDGLDPTGLKVPTAGGSGGQPTVGVPKTGSGSAGGTLGGAAKPPVTSEICKLLPFLCKPIQPAPAQKFNSVAPPASTGSWLPWILAGVILFIVARKGL